MMKGITCTLFCLTLWLAPAMPAAAWFGPANFSECLFEGLKGVGSDKAVVAVTAACKRRFPDEPRPGWFDSGNYDRCISENMRGIVNDKASLAIEAACRQLYKEER